MYKGYKGPGMCKMCKHAKRLENGFLRCSFYQDLCVNHGGTCKGIRVLNLDGVSKYVADKYTKGQRAAANKSKTLLGKNVDDYNLEVEKLTGIQQSCSVFGCGRLLTPVESLYGNKCFKHA